MQKVLREKWRKNFGEWYRGLLIDAGILDYRYPIKGCGVWLPYGFKIRRNVMQVIRKLLDSTGHEETLFPLLIPEISLKKEAAHVKSFEDECFWVTHGGLKPLRVRYALRPTSETAINPMLKLWIRSHVDLPLKLYQIVNIFRCETKATRPILRMREVSTFKEAHTAHSIKEEAETQVKDAIIVYKKFFDSLGVPYVISKRPDWDRFPGASYSIAFDTILPDGKTLQIGTVHNLGQNFAKAFDVSFEDENGERAYVWQTCYGISARAIAAMLIIHGDDRGAVLPPELAPLQIIVIPIPFEAQKAEINGACENVVEKLRKVGIRAKIDYREDLTPGAKYYYWEVRGVPIRIEIGPRDVEREEATVVRRDTFEKSTCSIENFEGEIQDTINTITKDMQQNASGWMKTHIHVARSLKEAKQLLIQKAGIIEVPLCGREACGSKLEEELDVRVLGTPFDSGELSNKPCVICGGDGKTMVRVAGAY